MVNILPRDFVSVNSIFYFPTNQDLCKGHSTIITIFNPFVSMPLLSTHAISNTSQQRLLVLTSSSKRK